MELRIDSLVKCYKNVPALDGFSAVLTEGIYGLIGPNGSGKTTLMKLITKNLAPDSGKVYLNGEDTDRLGGNYLSLIGYMPQEARLYPQLGVLDFMYYSAALKGIDKSAADRMIPGILDEVSLSDASRKRISQLSGGMRQRLCFAQALLGDPPILLLDEPAAGLDPSQRARVRSMLSRMASDRIILLATHVISDAEGIAGNLILLSRGKLEAMLPPGELVKRLEGRVFTVPAGMLGALPSDMIEMSAPAVMNGAPAFRVVCESPPDGGVLAVPTLEDAYLYFYRDRKGSKSGSAPGIDKS